MINISAILFDLVGVLLFKRKDYKPNLLVDKVDSLIGKVTDDKKFKKATIKNFNLKEKEFDEVLEKVVNKYEPFQPIWELLPELRKHYKLAIINNGTALTLPSFKTKHKIDKYFDLFISSAIEGVKKPKREIYLLAVKKLGIKPNECLFMDDLEENVKGAEEVGMKTIYWENKKKVLRNL